MGMHDVTSEVEILNQVLSTHVLNVNHGQGCDIHLVLTNIHVYIHQKCIYTYIHIHIHQDLVLWQLQPLQT